MIDFDTFFRCYKSNTHFWHTSNFQSSKKAILHWGSCVFPDVILVSNYRSYKEKTIKLLPYHSFYGGHIPPRKTEPLFLAVRLKKNKKNKKQTKKRTQTKLPGFPFSSIP